MFTFIIGSFNTNFDAEPIEDFNYQDLNFHHYKYTPFRTWKWYIFLFEASIVFETIISIFFWTILFPNVQKVWNDPKIDTSDLSKLSTVLDHSAPLALLLFDFSYNAVPIA